MNYYEHHIGDYDEATAHLTACEDGIYSRMIRKYYATEKPLPADLGKLARLVRAHTKEEKKAVATVASEFFSRVGDELHQRKCDEIIAAYNAKAPEREVKKTNEALRLQRHREERAALFSQLNAVGQHAAWNTGTQALRDLVKQYCPQEPAGPATQPATAPATPATANQSPVPNPHLPVTKTIDSSAPASPTPPAKAPAAPAKRPPAAAKPAGEEPPTAEIWRAYSKAYELVYRTQPVRNAKVNSQLKQFLDRIGAEEAPSVAAFFLSHQNPLYVRACHPVDLLLKDAEGLRTQWKTGRTNALREPTESLYQRSKRQTVEAATGGLASRKPLATEVPHGQPTAPAIAG